MILKQNVSKLFAFGLIAVILGISSCKDEQEQRLTIQDTADLTEEALTDAYFQDMDDMAGIAIESPTETEYSSGRTAGSIAIQDHRFTCEGIVISLQPDAASTAEMPKGVLTVDFGTIGCTDQNGNVRKGKLIFTYSGKRFMPASTVVTTTEDYFINGISLEGTRTLTNVQNPLSLRGSQHNRTK